ncbi:unnamed protein product [Prunus armeniaca]|uniref:Uncharacterized protein n=1 Tax=Prunus armeniaca TaxID=36596 RepID=A0A6J5TYM2_PRUAR|nr:unnamed protein product [Prunus armeniaca]
MGLMSMYESQLGSHPITSGELGYEIQIREAVVRPNCLTILRFKGAETEEFGHFTCPKYRGHCNSSNTTEKA